MYVVKQVTTQEVQQLLAAGAQLVDVLPVEKYVEDHLPGAVNLPMADIATATKVLDASKPVIVYCYDRQCDLSSRAAARLESMKFAEVYDYVDSKVAWLAEGLPSAGLVDDSRRAISRLHTDLPSVGPDTRLGDLPDAATDWEVVAVTDEHNVVLGVVRREADDVAPDTPVATVMQPAPPTVRPSIPLRELAQTMDKNGEDFLLVTKLDGQLMGLVRRAELDAA
jgi:rhodanese-related sulfurtransferase/CBS domain-containing protein